MGKKDKNHKTVIEVCEKEGFTILDDPYKIRWGTHPLEIDLLIAKDIGINRTEKRILFEIKSFVKSNITSHLDRAVGQYLRYLDALNLKNIPYDLYLVMPEYSYKLMKSDQASLRFLKKQNIKYMVYNTDSKGIIEWNPAIL